jgi:hypothetical protein
LPGLIIITATGRIGLIASPTMADKAGMIDGAIMIITGLAGMVGGVILIEMTTIALAIPSSLITARGGRASTAKHEGRGELAPPPEVSDGHA